MLFNSIQFFVFFLLFFTAYWALQHRGRSLLLLFSSYFFYGYWDWRFLGLLWFSTVVDFCAGLMISNSTTSGARKRWLAVSICVNLGLLGFFKYFNFFAGSLQAMLTAMGMHASFATLNVILPVGISFYTFQSLSYTIDVYRGDLKPARRLYDFALFVSFFPQLVAGPIERATSLMPQVLTPKKFSWALVLSGLELMVWGYFKKVFIADNLAPIVDHVFSTSVEQQTGLQLLLGIYAFALQIYGDFSGYSDIARGVARCLGVELMVNFRCPYFSANPQEFWKRWHISLSTWLRDYLYFSLGGNRGGPGKTYRNLIATMLLGGLWHGAAWTYVLWGLYQGILLVLHRLWVGRVSFDRTSPVGALSTVKRFIGIALFFQIVCGGWLLFRASSVQQVWNILCALPFHWSLGSTEIYYLRMLGFLGWYLVLVEMIWFLRERTQGDREEMPRPTYRTWLRVALILFQISSVFLFGAWDAQSFIYFQF